MSHENKSLATTFAAVLGFLIILAFAFYFIAGMVVGDSKDAAADNAQAIAAADENIKPVGSVVVAGESSAGAVAAGPRSGADIYNSACMACHATGAAGAPKTGDKAAWEPRFKQGMDTLLKHTLEGFNAMPPKGTCGDCSDDELKGAVAHMLNETGFKVEVAAPAAAAPAPAAAADGKKIFDSSCMACHSTGAAGAPMVGDKAAWAPRIAQGMDTLLTHSMQGINAMPPKGTCAACSDDDLKAAIEYMVEQSK